jgi:RNA methyltransferase, TrmH family
LKLRRRGSNGVHISGIINSPKNERIRKYRRLRKKNFRYREGKFLVEGYQAVTEALLYKKKPECLICNQKGIETMGSYADLMSELSIPCFEVSDEVITTLSTTVTPQGIIAVSSVVHIDLFRLTSESTSTILVANRVRDPGNLGNMLRIADAAGAGGMIICRESADPYNAKTVRSSAGSIFHLPLAIGPGIVEAVQQLKQDGYTVFTTDAHSGTNMWEAEWPGKVALVMGNEAWGIPEDEEAIVDGRVRVPILGGAESLNVSAAAALLLYEIERERAIGKREEGRNK